MWWFQYRVNLFVVSLIEVAVNTMFYVLENAVRNPLRNF